MATPLLNELIAQNEKTKKCLLQVSADSGGAGAQRKACFKQMKKIRGQRWRFNVKLMAQREI